jgi:hypothetical protein
MNNTKNYRKFAVLTGVSIVIMTVVSALIMGMVFVPAFNMNVRQFSEQLPEIKSPLLFGLMGWIVILVCDLLATWGLYKFYSMKNKFKSQIMGLLRLIYSVILIIAIFQLAKAVISSSEAEESYSLLISFQSIWQFGLIFFGIHLLFLADLVYERRMILRVIGILLFIAGIGYMGSNIADLLIDNYEQIRSKAEAVFILPMVLGEFGLAIWLLVKGGHNGATG